MRAEGFSCSLDVLYGGLSISKLQFLIKKRKKSFSCICFIFWFSKPRPYPDPDSLEMLDPDPDSMNPDPQHCVAPLSSPPGRRATDTSFGAIVLHHVVSLVHVGDGQYRSVPRSFERNQSINGSI